MAVYRMGKVIFMIRNALGMTQEELVEIYDGNETEEERNRKKILDSTVKTTKEEKIQENGQKNVICSTQVLRRIEKGTVNRVKIDIFRKIMIKIGLLPERYYASLLVTDYRAMAWEVTVHIHINNEEYEKAESILQKMEKVMVTNYPRNQQYLMERRGTIAYRQRKISPEEYIEILRKALRFTIPMLDNIDIAKWPLNKNEVFILSGMVNAYRALKDKQKELELLLKLKDNLEERYMDWTSYVTWHTHMLIGLSQHMCLQDKYKESIQYCKIGIKECKKHNILGYVYNFLYDIVWCREQKIKKEILSREEISKEQELQIRKERAKYIKLLAQGYLLSLAQGNRKGAQRIKNLCERYYPGEVKWECQ